MAYILKDAQGLIIASRAEQNSPEASAENWQFVESNTPEYIDFLEKAFKIIKRCKEGEPIKKFLKSEVSYSPFDRLN